MVLVFLMFNVLILLRFVGNFWKESCVMLW